MERAARTGLFLALAVASAPALGERPVVDWLRIEPYTTYATSGSGLPPLSLTPLVDGSLLVLAGARATRLDANGAELSSVLVGAPSDGVVVDRWGFAYRLDPRAGGLAVMRVDLRTGRRAWTSAVGLEEADEADRTVLHPAGERLLVAAFFRVTGMCRVTALEAATGSRLWGPVEVWDQLPEDILVDRRGDVLLASQHGPARKVEGSTGRVLWSTGLWNTSATPLRGGVALDREGSLLIVRRSWGGLCQLWRLGAVDGRRNLWATFETSFRDRLKEVTLAGSTAAGDPIVLAEGGPGGLEVSIRSVRDGGLLLSTRRDGSSAGAILGAGWVPCLYSADGELVLLWKRSCSGDSRAGPDTLARYCLVLERIASAGTTVWSREYPSERLDHARAVLAPAGDVWVATDYGIRLDRLAGRTGEVLAKGGDVARPRRRGFTSLIVDPRGNALFAWRDSHGLEDPLRLVMLKGGTGEELWAPIERPGGQVVSMDHVGDFFMHVRDGSGRFLEKRDGRTGGLTWSVPVAEMSLVELAPDGNVILLPSDDRGRVVELDGETGSVRWTAELNAPVRALTASLTGVFVAIASPSYDLPVGSSITRLARENGARLGTTALGFTPSHLRVDSRGDVVAACMAGPAPAAAKLDTARGTLAWVTVLSEIWGSLGEARLDPSGDLVLAFRDRPGADYGQAAGLSAVKLSGSTGEVLWRARVGSSADAGSDTEPVAFDLDTQGNPLLPRRLVSAAGEPFVAATRLRGRDGTELDQSDALPGSAPRLASLPGVPGGLLLAFLGTAGHGLARLSPRFGLSGLVPGSPIALGPALCGRPYDGAIEFVNGSAPVTAILASGALPPGLILDRVTGGIRGAPEAAGTFSFSVRAFDASGASVQGDVVLDVLAAGEPLSIFAETLSQPCAPSLVGLRVPGLQGSVTWLPGGETSPSITVSPLERTSYGVIATDASGCPRAGLVTVEPSRLSDTTPPEVEPPAPLLVRQTACRNGPGVPVSTSSTLAAFLSSGSARDGCGLVERLPPIVDLEPLAPDHFLRSGVTAVTFRFRDSAGNLGSATSSVTVRALGDLNLDTLADPSDAGILALYLVGDTTPGDGLFQADLEDADTTRDGVVDILDVVLLASHPWVIRCLTP